VDCRSVEAPLKGQFPERVEDVAVLDIIPAPMRGKLKLAIRLTTRGCFSSGEKGAVDNISAALPVVCKEAALDAKLLVENSLVRRNGEGLG
jgi:hypothetical protein